jgi:AcrR family transcriptional regulator
VDTFQRARSEEQRAIRSQAILHTAAAMLTEMPVSQLALNELSRRVGLAKSNVLRYFESREAVLLELLNTAAQAWLEQFADELAARVDAGAESSKRSDQLADTLASSLTARPMLCELISAQAAVLEHNVSPHIVAKHKRAARAHVAALVQLILDHVPELGERDAAWFAGAAIMMTGTVWTHANPPAAVEAAYAADPSLASMRIEFTETLRQMLEVMLVGLLDRPSR